MAVSEKIPSVFEKSEEGDERLKASLTNPSKSCCKF